ncbi:amino acid permease [Pseudoclavibacter endophyticus]|uniref:APC family permease n=1 Tax=Pseudoclavibacter endophyticus TaxID=1778590 RepID=A0A6H9WK64_9MICO|nr:APC family permease [Pseudoclavibacter endophyticus]KAB1649256.1 APC family permease [Pseudoclavibacter endophyticus]GGA64064.1 amino acid permease [Pseudoclavibacter endophyticus]
MTDTTTTLTRTLRLPSLVIFGLAYLTPLIVLGIFGVIASQTGGASASAYLLALAAMLFTANSYGRMAAAYPVAGSAYTYVRRTIDGRVGFLVGWATLLDYLFLPMVIWLIGGSYLQAQFPGVPMAVWILAFIVLTTVLNLVGIKVADRVNLVLMSFQILVIVFFVVLALADVAGADGAGALVSATPFTGVDVGLLGIAGGAAIAAYSFLGFDAVTTLTEETIEPRKTVPKAIMLVALIGGGIFVVVSYAVQLVHPGGVFDNADAAAFEIATRIGGAFFGAVFLAALVVAQFTSGIAAQAAGSRLLYAMGRDGVLPRRVFGALSPRFRTPMLSILVIAAVGLIAMFMDVATSTSFINFGAFIAFIMVNVSVIVYWAKRRRDGERLNPLLYLVCPTVGVAVIAFLLTQLDMHAITLGSIWLAVGVVILAIVTRGFRRQPPELPVEEAERVEA